MSLLDLNRSFRRAADRLEKSTARRRADAGATRLDPRVSGKLRELLSGYDRPRVVEIMNDMRSFCEVHKLACPSRAWLYHHMAIVDGHSYQFGDLPAPVRSCLYNLSDKAAVPGHQLVFYCFHYGGLTALCFAAGLPWLDLYQAARAPGWRPRTRGMLLAVLRARGI